MDPTLLQSSKLFAGLDVDSSEALASMAEERKLATGASLVQQGDAGTAVYIVLSGTTEASSRSAEDGLEYNHPAPLVGDDCGLAESLCNATHAVSVRAKTSMRVAVIPREGIAGACGLRPELAVALMTRVSVRACAERVCRTSPVVDLSRVRLDERLWELIPRPILARHRALPLALHGGVLIVGFVDPADPTAREEVQRAVPALRVRPVPLDALGFDQTYRTRVIAAVERKTGGMDDARWYASVKHKAYDFKFLESSVTNTADDKVPAVPGDVVISLMNKIIGEALDLAASDIHIEPTEHELLVRFRVDGHLRRRPEAIERKLAAPLVSRLKVLARMDIAERRRAQDGRIALAQGNRRIDLRLATVPARFGERIVLRILDPVSILIDLEKLLLVPAACDAFKAMLDRPQGMVIVAGPTGSGKTTSIYSAILRLRKSDINILTIEDPIEYGVEGVTQVQVNEGAQVTFSTAVRNFLRQDPDVIVVGETRDPLTAATSVEAALTGHLVLTSLHANDAIGALVRLREMGIEPFLLAHTVIGVISQRLVRRICPHCREPAAYHRDLVQPLGLFADDDTTMSYTLFKGRGCALCNFQGFRGRAAVFEVLTIDDKLRIDVASGASAGALQEAATTAGLLQPMRDYCRHLVTAGVTTPEEVARVLFMER